MKWFWLTFGNEEGPVGGAWIRAKNGPEAIAMSYLMSINPGSDHVLCLDMPGAFTPRPMYANRFLTLQEAEDSAPSKEDDEEGENILLAPGRSG